MFCCVVNAFKNQDFYSGFVVAKVSVRSPRILPVCIIHGQTCMGSAYPNNISFSFGSKTTRLFLSVHDVVGSDFVTAEELVRSLRNLFIAVAKQNEQDQSIQTYLM